MSENNNQNIAWAQIAALYRQPFAPLSENQLNSSRMAASAPALQLYPTPATGPSADHLLCTVQGLMKEKAEGLKREIDMKREIDRLRSELREAAHSADKGDDDEDGDATHHRQQANAIRKRKRLEGSKEAREKKIKRAADDVCDFCKARFPDGMYCEMGVAAIGHILEHNPHEIG